MTRHCILLFWMKSTQFVNRGKNTLETSGEDVKLHSEQVEKMLQLHPKRVEKMNLVDYGIFFIYMSDQYSFISFWAYIFTTRFECGFAIFPTRFECSFQIINIFWLIGGVVVAFLNLTGEREKSSPLVTSVFLHLLHSFRVYFYIFSTRFECIFTSSPLVRVYFYIFSTRFECIFISSPLV